MSPSVPFVKMHGLGNDYVYVDGFDVAVADPPALSRAVSDRHRGIGSDGLILIEPPRGPGTIAMRMFNADGSEAEMCGNGIRCVARLAIEAGRAEGPEMAIETGAGLLHATVTETGSAGDWAVRIDMGAPERHAPDVPVVTDGLEPTPGAESSWIVTIGDHRLPCRFVSMGNPHAVTWVDDVDAFDLAAIGPVFETHPAFPARINLHVAQVVGPDHVRMRTWERGSGLTQACGTGACAVGVAAIDEGRTGRTLRTTLPGGDLEIAWPADDGPVFMTGPATRVYDGVWPIES